MKNIDILYRTIDGKIFEEESLAVAHTETLEKAYIESLGISLTEDFFEEKKAEILRGGRPVIFDGLPGAVVDDNNKYIQSDAGYSQTITYKGVFIEFGNPERPSYSVRKKDLKRWIETKSDL